LNAANRVCASIQLTGGQAYQIKMEYFENEGDASARLLWRRQGGRLI